MSNFYLCFQGHFNKKGMHNITLVNITIQLYFVLLYKHFAMHLFSNKKGNHYQANGS